jgi:hypothetical protein
MRIVFDPKPREEQAMRIYANPYEAYREIERDLWEMGIRVHPQTMQDKKVGDDPGYETVEVRAYGYKIHGFTFNEEAIMAMIQYSVRHIEDDPDEIYDPVAIMDYINVEFADRVERGFATNPGRSWEKRYHLWSEFLHGGQFAYTYSERMAPQVKRILMELRKNPETRQGIINLHSNICPEIGQRNLEGVNSVTSSADLAHIGASGGRIPCSVYYQLMIREGAVDLIYCMRSCDFVTHLPVDMALALRLQQYAATVLNLKVGNFTHFMGSLHAYAKDLKGRGIF